MKKNKPYCEPFCIQQGYNFEVHHVSYSDNDPYSCFMHFHEVHELIVFEKIEGTFFYNQGESSLQDYDMVFTPALETHDFELSSRQKSWHIIQFLPSFLADNGLASAESFFKYGMLEDARKIMLDLIKQGLSEEDVVVKNPLKKYHNKWNWGFITTEKMTRTLYTSLSKKKNDEEHNHHSHGGHNHSEHKHNDNSHGAHH